MYVYALVGVSGSGKSHRAAFVADKYNIPLILDDGLMIYKGRVLAGKSAKRDKRKIQAIRTAILLEEDHLNELKEALKKVNENKILVLGTSMRMIERIVSNLNLDGIDKIIKIDEIANKDEIKKAINTRKNEGKHVIPVPKIEVKSRFPGYFIHSLELFFGKGQSSIKKEKTIVRPKFSYFGNLIIYNHVIRDLISFELNKESNITEINSIQIEKEDNEICVNIEIILKYGVEIINYINSVQERLNKSIEKFTGLYLDNLNFYVSSLYVE
ncbi:MAG TPA: Asp23/Gls24 family envelope stress response protein [Halanaerobiales bacterium]|nr:Asp23/Gls24 family envelope stress response protein [Halanaerobiales bacterium]